MQDTLVQEFKLPYQGVFRPQKRPSVKPWDCLLQPIWQQRNVAKRSAAIYTAQIRAFQDHPQGIR